jgi:hypothetical protein
MTQEIPAWLGTIREFNYRLPAPVDTNLKSASKNQMPAYIATAIYGKTRILAEPKPTKEQVEQQIAYDNRLRQAATTKNQEQVRNRIKSAAKRLGIRPTSKPTWMRLHDNLFYGYSSR